MDLRQSFTRLGWYTIIVTGSLLRIISCFQHNPVSYLFSDPKRHWLNAERLMTSSFMGGSDPILYQLYLAFVRMITGDNAFALASCCTLLSLLMPWTYYRAAREFGLAKSYSLAAWALISITPSLITIYHYFMMETLLLPLVGLALWMTARCLRKKDRVSFLWAVFIWTLACLTKATVLPLAGICLIWIWWITSKQLSHALLAVSLVLLLLLPNTIRTEHLLGFPAPFGNSWLTKIQHRSGDKRIRIHFNRGVWEFSSPSCYMRPLEPFSDWMMQRALRESTIEIWINSKNGSSDWHNAYKNLHIEEKEWFSQLGENLVLSLFAASWPDNNVAEWDGRSSYLARWIWLPIVIFVLGCNLLEWTQGRFHLLPIAISLFTLFLIFQNVATAEGRYRKPLEPLLLMNMLWVIAPDTKKKEV